jgi:hypothetical protein
MPLDDKEQKILEEIERQFYEEDPALARAVQRIERPNRFGVKLSVLGVLAGLAIIVYFISVTWIAAGGFVLLVISAASLAQSLRVRGWDSHEPEPQDYLED